MSASVSIPGLDEFRRMMQNLPEDLASEANTIVDAHAREAARQAQDGYPEGPTGNLKRGVTTNVTQSRFGGSAVVRARAPHAYIFEKGTKNRRTGKGYDRGAMPQAPVSQQFIPKAIRARARMVFALVDMLRRSGLEVSE